MGKISCGFSLDLIIRHFLGLATNTSLSVDLHHPVLSCSYFLSRKATLQLSILKSKKSHGAISVYSQRTASSKLSPIQIHIHHCRFTHQCPKKRAPKVGIKTGKPICCCCPDTKKLRDECVVMKGEEHPDCVKLIEMHKVCLREEGFNVK